MNFMGTSKQINIIIIILVTAILIYIYIKVNRNEFFVNENNNNVLKNQDDMDKYHIAKDKTPNIFDINKQFSEVIVYENDTDGRMGLDKCLEYCTPTGGTCTEYGISGNAWCYPVVKYEPKNFRDDISAPNETKLTYVNM